ncbi:hypothetical protein [Haloferula sargassicola]|uniref:DNA helicase n=1 Tax=Haloferula sargassicola TaxID=490096 RepID=A0ABP9UJ07_9BACT
MAILIPPKPHAAAPAPVMRMFRLLKKLGDDFTVRHLLDADGPQFLIVWRDRHAFLLHVAATSQELADRALSPSFFSDAEAVDLDEIGRPEVFGGLASDLPVRRLVVFPNVDNSTVDQIERLRSEDSGVSFLGLKQTPPERFASHLEALAEPPLSESMLLTLRERFDAGSRIHDSAAVRRIPLSSRLADEPLPPAFLDLDQETLAKLDIALPHADLRLAERFDTRLVTGPAGCGKSLVLLHRALFAARLNRGARLLLLTHNRPINAELRRRAVATAPEGSRMQALSFFAWARKHLPDWPQRILPAAVTRERLAALMDGVSTNLTPAFVAEEIGYLRDLGIGSLDEYLALDRSGRLMALTGPRREAVWSLLEKYRADLARRGESDWHEVALRFRDFAREHPERLRAQDFIFIDEAQFFAKVWFEPVLAALNPGGQLFLAADPTQGFLKRRDSWLAAGIDVRGRASRLRTPYRSTRAILGFARDLLARRAALHPDAASDLDPPTDADLAAVPEEGEAPVILSAASPHDALARVVREIHDLRETSPHLAGSVLVLHADSFATGGLVNALRAKLGPDAVADLNHSRDPQPVAPFCQVSTCMAATGLEAAVVFLLGVDILLEKEGDPRLDEAARAELAADHTRLLYMACTRAARRLVVFSSRLS